MNFSQTFFAFYLRKNGNDNNLIGDRNYRKEKKTHWISETAIEILLLQLYDKTQWWDREEIKVLKSEEATSLVNLF